MTKYILCFFLTFISIAYANKEVLYIEKDTEELTDAIFPRTDPYKVGDIYQILKVMDKVFKKHGIHYWIDFGTLLGAERHGGFIPWDDDADICLYATDINNVGNLDSVFARYGLILWKRHPLPWKIHFPGQVHYSVDLFFLWDVPHSPNGELSFHSDWTGHWYRNEVETSRKVAFGPLTLNAPSHPWRRLYSFYGEDCMEKAVYRSHVNPDIPHKVNIVDFSPAEYAINQYHRIICLD